VESRLRDSVRPLARGRRDAQDRLIGPGPRERLAGDDPDDPDGADPDAESAAEVDQ